jgi:hypothetical protein
VETDAAQQSTAHSVDTSQYLRREVCRNRNSASAIFIEKLTGKVCGNRGSVAISSTYGWIVLQYLRRRVWVCRNRNSA